APPPPWFWSHHHPPHRLHHHHHGCHCQNPPKKESSFPSAFNDMLDRVKGIPGTHEFTFTRNVEEKKDPWAEYYEKLAAFYKQHPEEHPDYRAHFNHPYFHRPAHPHPHHHHGCCGGH
ncbi:hypothetical protein H4S01_003703, partial [Coemansia sp. RSA 2610]